MAKIYLEKEQLEELLEEQLNEIKELDQYYNEQIKKYSSSLYIE